MESDIKNSITFQIVPEMTKRDCRSFKTFTYDCKRRGFKFDRILISDSSSLIEKVASLQENHPFKRTLSPHSFTPSFFSCIEGLLKRSGIFLLETTTMNEKRMFGGRYGYSASIPSIHGLMDATYHGSTLTLEHVDNLGLHHSETLKQWRSRLNSIQLSSQSVVGSEYVSAQMNEVDSSIK